MKDDWWFKFEHLKWLTDEQLSRCSLETQGFWARCICVMRKSGSAKLAGSIAELSRLLSVTPTEFKKCFAELDRTKTATVTQTANLFTLMSRKFQKELKVREQNRLRKQKERGHADVTTKSGPHSKSKSKEIEKEKKEETPPKTAAKKGTRIPDQFFLTSEMKEWAKEKRPDVDLQLETEKFCNHFRSKTGRDATKLDWVLTWKNWILNARGTNGTHKQSTNGNGKRTDAEVLAESAEFYRNYPG